MRQKFYNYYITVLRNWERNLKNIVQNCITITLDPKRPEGLKDPKRYVQVLPNTESQQYDK